MQAECITGFSIQINFKISGGKLAEESMGRPPLRNTGEGTEVESVVSIDRRQKMSYPAERTG